MQLVQNVLTTLATATAIVSLTGCLAGPGFLKQQGNASLVSDSSKVNATVVSSQDGAITGAITGNSGDTQVLSAAEGSGIEGASVLFPPGSLGVDANITVEAGVSLASDATAAELGLDNDFTAASDAVVVSADTDLEAINPFTIAISMSGSGLVEIDRARVVIVFKAKKADGTFVTGVIPNSQLTFDGDKVQFETTKFGSFQAVTTAALITEKKEVATAAPIVTKREEVVLPEPKDFKVVTVEPKAIRLAWASGGGSTAGFAMVFGNDSAPPSCAGAKMTGDLNKVSGTIDKLVPNKTYGFRLCSVDKDGKQSAGVVLTESTLSLPFGAIGAFAISVPSTDDSNVTINWSSAANADLYIVSVSKTSACTNPIASEDTPGRTASFDLPDGRFFACVKALNADNSQTATPRPFEIETTSLEILARSFSTNNQLLHISYEAKSGEGVSAFPSPNAGTPQIPLPSPKAIKIAENAVGDLAFYYSIENIGVAPQAILFDSDTGTYTSNTPLYDSPSGSFEYGFLGSFLANDTDWLATFSKKNSPSPPFSSFLISGVFDFASPTPISTVTPIIGTDASIEIHDLSTAIDSAGNVNNFAVVTEGNLTQLRFGTNGGLTSIGNAWFQNGTCEKAVFASMALDSSNNPHVAIYCAASSNLGCSVRYGKQLTGGSWQFNTLWSRPDLPCTLTENLRPDVAVNKANNAVHVAWFKPGNAPSAGPPPIPASTSEIQYATFPANSTTAPSIVNIPGRPSGHFVTGPAILRLDQFGFPYIAGGADSGNTGSPPYNNIHVFVADKNQGTWRWSMPAITGDDEDPTHQFLVDYSIGDFLIRGSPGRSKWAP